MQKIQFVSMYLQKHNLYQTLHPKPVHIVTTTIITEQICQQVSDNCYKGKLYGKPHL